MIRFIDVTDVTFIKILSLICFIDVTDVTLIKIISLICFIDVTDVTLIKIISLICFARNGLLITFHISGFTFVKIGAIMVVIVW